MKELTVVFYGKSLLVWGGGVDFLRNCATALVQEQTARPIKLVLLMPVHGFRSRIRNWVKPYKALAKDILSLRLPRFFRETALDLESAIAPFKKLEPHLSVQFIEDSPKGFTRALKKLSADVIFPAMDSLSSDFPVPWIGYIPDLQHKHLPQYFTPIGSRIRDRNFRRILDDARAVIVNSKAAKEDIQHFYPGEKARIFNLPFAPIPLEEWFLDNWEKCKRKYSIPEKYFLVSNQFWVHKDHSTIFDAFAGLVSHDDVHLVCTGKTDEPRSPQHFPSLLKKLKDLSLEDRVHILGYIPKDDQIQIMKKSIAVVQPTLFEGGPGGGAVYDAVALGVPAIISDISVNREIEGEDIRFFKANSAIELASHLSEILNSEPRQQVPIEFLRAKGQARAKKLAEKLLEVAEYVVKIR